MTTRKVLQNQLIQFKKTASDIERASGKEPEGRIVIKRISNGCTDYYYVCPDNKGKVKYLPHDSILIQRYLQKRYNHRVFSILNEQIKVIESFLEKYSESAIKDVYNDFDEISKKQLTVYDYPDDVYAKIWETDKYEANPYPKPDSDFITMKKETVRSKSEVLIANCLWVSGIPYRYECPLKVDSYTTVYPDFTILNKRTREVFYWEHFGRMDSDDYRTKSIRKIEQYVNLGIFPGKSLIITMEDYRNPLNVRIVEQFIAAYLT